MRSTTEPALAAALAVAAVLAAAACGSDDDASAPPTQAPRRDGRRERRPTGTGRTAAPRRSADAGRHDPAPRRRGARHDPHRLPADPQRRPRRQAQGLARGGVRPRHRRSSGSCSTRAATSTRRSSPARIDIGLAGSSPARVASRPASSTRCRGSSTSSARPRPWSRSRHHVDRRPQRQDDRDAVRVDGALQPARRAAGRRRDRDDVKIIDAEPDAIYAAWSPARSTPPTCGTRTWPRSSTRAARCSITSAELAAQGQDHLRPRGRGQRLRREVPRRRRRWVDAAGPGGRADPRRSRRRGRGRRRRAQHHARRGRGPGRDLIFLTAAEQVGARLPRRRAGGEPVRRGRVQQGAGQDRDRAARSGVRRGRRRHLRRQRRQ